MHGIAMNEADKFALVPRPPGALEKAESGTKRVLANMVQDALTLARAKTQAENIPALPIYANAELENWCQKGTDYRFGNGVAQDYAEAVKWYRKAAAQGHAKAQYMLGFMYEHGRGVDKDEGEATNWYCKSAESYRKAADRGEAKAQFSLSNCYLLGSGVSQNDAEAVHWCRKAAEQGDAAAQEFLGRNYNFGLFGVPRDYAEAVKWLPQGSEPRRSDGTREPWPHVLQRLGCPARLHRSRAVVTAERGSKAKRWHNTISVCVTNSGMVSRKTTPRRRSGTARGRNKGARRHNAVSAFAMKKATACPKMKPQP